MLDVREPVTLQFDRLAGANDGQRQDATKFGHEGLPCCCDGIECLEKALGKKVAVAARLQRGNYRPRFGTKATPRCRPMSGVLLMFCKFSVNPNVIRKRPAR